jgi:tetraacyldisaccharide 4'-kinase
LERTFDLVLIDATNPFGGNHLLPAGLLREPVKNLRRADAFVITRSDEIADISPICRRLQQINPKVPIFSGRHGYDEIKSVATHQSVALDVLKDQRLLEVSGIANPASFHRLLRGLNLPVVHYLDFPDHHWYTEQDLSNMQRIISTHHIESIITTEKDEVKLLRHVDILNVPIYGMAIRLEVCPGEEFEKLLLDIV